jgi:5-methylthioribose kinase
MDSIDNVRVYVESIQSSMKLDKSINLEEFSLFDIKLLSGGLVNYVYRLYFKSKTSHETQTTAILKYFPPYVAIDKSVPFSQERFYVESSALVLLTDSPWLKLNPGSISRTPKLFHADTENFTIIMEDVDEQAQSLLDLLKKDCSALSNEFIKNLAKEIKFFIEYLAISLGVTPQNYSEFENKSTSNVLAGYLKQVWHEQANLAGLESELSEYLDQSEVIFKEPDLSTDKVVLTFGDLWPNSIMIDVEANRVWFIDWEAARFQTDPLRDMEQLMCNLWLMKQNESIFDAAKIEFLVEELQEAHLGEREKDWRSVSSFQKSKFILWTLSLVKEKHWGIANTREVMLKALEEIKSL